MVCLGKEDLQRRGWADINNRDVVWGYLIPAAIFSTVLLICSVFVYGEETDQAAVYTIAYEASGQTIEGQIAVAAVIKQRMIDRHQTSEQVVKAPHQFSCWNAKTGKPTQNRKLSKKEIRTARIAWDLAAPTKFNHYARFDCKPSWIKAAKASVRIGDHIFYRL